MSNFASRFAAFEQEATAEVAATVAEITPHLKAVDDAIRALEAKGISATMKSITASNARATDVRFYFSLTAKLGSPDAWRTGA